MIGPRNLPDGAAQVARIAEVHGGNRGDGQRRNLLRVYLDAQRQAHQDGQLGARVKAAHILGRIGLGKALGLRLSQHRSVLRPLLHLAQNEVAGAVQNAFNALDAIPGQPLLQPRNHRNSAGHGRAVLQVSAPGRGQPLQLDAVNGDQFLVGGDHALARAERLAYPAARRIKPAGQLHHHIHVGGQHSIGVLAPHHARRNPIRVPARHAADVYMGQFEAIGPGLDQNSRHRTRHRSKTKQSDAQRTPHQGRLRGKLLRRCGNIQLGHGQFLLGIDKSCDNPMILDRPR